MTEHDRHDAEGRPADGGCPALAPGLATAYARGEIGAAATWSVEAHVPGCAACRAALAGGAQRDRLAVNRSVLLARLGLPAAGPASRVLRRCGVPEHILTILAATPSLRRSWLTGVLLALAAAVGAAYLLAPGAAARTLLGGPAAGSAWAGLIPFLVLAPTLPLAAVAAAFSARLDPASDLATAAPVSGVWLLCVRAVAVIGATLLPTVLAALALPGPGWLPAAVLLPALAGSAAALAVSTVAGAVPAAVGVGAGWVAAVVAVGVVTDSPAPVLGPVGQLASLAVLIGAAATVAARRARFDFGGTG
jgi:hypothetical protein